MELFLAIASAKMQRLSFDLIATHSMECDEETRQTIFIVSKKNIAHISVVINAILLGVFARTSNVESSG